MSDLLNLGSLTWPFISSLNIPKEGSFPKLCLNLILMMGQNGEIHADYTIAYYTIQGRELHGFTPPCANLKSPLSQCESIFVSMKFLPMKR